MRATIFKNFFNLATGLLIGLSTLATNVSAQTSELIDLLASQTGISTEQATGGAGALFNYAKSALSTEQFSQISNALPEITKLIQSTPVEKGSISDAVSDLAASLGSSSDTVADLSKINELKNSFDQLGIGTEQMQSFIPIIIDYAKSHGGEVVSSLLNQALTL